MQQYMGGHPSGQFSPSAFYRFKRISFKVLLPSSPNALTVHSDLRWLGHVIFPLFGCRLTTSLWSNDVSVSMSICMIVYMIFKNDRLQYRI